MSMTANLAPRRRSKAQTAISGTEAQGLAIGEIGRTVFSCPNCLRPLAVGVRRCPGCSSRLVLGVQVGRASTFVMVGLIFGVAFGGGLGAVLSAARLPAHDAQIAELAASVALAQAAQIQAAASQAALPTHAIVATGGSTGSGTASTIPGITASALSQALVLDTRFTDSTTAFETALAAPKLSIEDVSQLLRNASADATIGLQLVDRINPWPDGAAVSGQLSTFYTSVQSVAVEGLGSSIRDEAAYRSAATSMSDLLAGLAAIDSRARHLATTNGISIPAAVAPAR
jgi:hypothetical protein